MSLMVKSTIFGNENMGILLYTLIKLKLKIIAINLHYQTNYLYTALS